MKFSKSFILKIAVPLAVAAGLALLIALFYVFYLPKKYEGFVRACAEEFDLDEELLFAVIRTESNFRSNAVSDAGAVGLMQLMPPTAAFIADCLGEELDICTPSDNIRMGAWYLRYLYDKFGNGTLAVAAYNAGEGTVRGWLRDGLCRADEDSQEFPFSETNRYVMRVKKFYKYYKFFYFT